MHCSGGLRIQRALIHGAFQKTTRHHYTLLDSFVPSISGTSVGHHYSLDSFVPSISGTSVGHQFRAFYLWDISGTSVGHQCFVPSISGTSVGHKAALLDSFLSFIKGLYQQLCNSASATSETFVSSIQSRYQHLCDLTSATSRTTSVITASHCLTWLHYLTVLFHLHRSKPPLHCLKCPTQMPMPHAHLYMLKV